MLLPTSKSFEKGPAHVFEYMFKRKHPATIRLAFIPLLHSSIEDDKFSEFVFRLCN